jgi:hypothetical protein
MPYDPVLTSTASRRWATPLVLVVAADRNIKTCGPVAAAEAGIDEPGRRHGAAALTRSGFTSPPAEGQVVPFERRKRDEIIAGRVDVATARSRRRCPSSRASCWRWR